jgi:4a-hydroxytetrahydrobiopterin dehydratase
MPKKTTYTCTDCNKFAPRAARASIKGFQSRHSDWEIVSEHGAEKLRKQYSFNDFDAAIEFAEQLVLLARKEEHHPVIRLERSTMRVFVTWWTKEIGGIHNQDLILAGQTDHLFDLSHINVWPDATTVISRDA